MNEEESRRFVAGIARKAGLDRCEREEARAHAAWQEARRALDAAIALQREHEDLHRLRQGTSMSDQQTADEKRKRASETMRAARVKVSALRNYFREKKLSVTEGKCEAVLVLLREIDSTL